MRTNPKLTNGLAMLAMSGMFLVACGGSSPGGTSDGAAGAGGAQTGGTGGKATGGAAGDSAGGAAGSSAGGSVGTGGNGPGGAGGGSTGGSGTATGGSGTATGGSGGAAGSSSSDAGGSAVAGAGGGSTDAASPTDSGGLVDAAVDVPPPAPATTLPTTPIAFGPIDCGAAGGTLPFSFSNTGNATLHYRASIAPGAIFSLQGAALDGSISADVSPGASATLTVVAGIVPTTSAAGAVLEGALTVTTNAAGAGSTQVSITMTAQGDTCTLTCGSFQKCTPSDASPYCANTMTDNANCGICGKTCSNGQICLGGACTLTCGALTTCTPPVGDAYCANTTTDNANCGACGKTCAPGQVCSGGNCTLTCGTLTTCTQSGGAAYCANTMTDDANCGVCSKTCAAGQSCMSGVCTATCSGSETVCNGVCTNTSFDPNNCGACGRTCAFPQGSAGCSGGNCFLTGCSAGYQDCNHVQTDGCESNQNTDAFNCGACGKSCALGETCVSAVCTANLSQGLIGYWKMDDAPGSTTAADSGPNNLPGLVQGNVTFLPTAGKQGSGAISLAGGGYIRVPFPNNALNQGTGISIPQGNMTFSMWFKTSATGPGGLQVVEGNAAWGVGCDRVVGNGSGSTLQYNAWEEVNMSGVTNVNDGNWHLMTYVLDESNGFLTYIDGNPDVSTTTATSNCGEGCSGFNWAAEYWIGYSANCRFGATYFSGLIDDVRMYNHVLSPTAALQLYNATK